MKKSLLIMGMFFGSCLVASDAKRAKTESPCLLDDGELTLDWLQDQCLELLTSIRKIGYTRYTEEDIDAVRTIEQAEELAKILGLAYVEALEKYRIKKSRPKKKLRWKSETKEDLEAVCVIPSRDEFSFELAGSEHYKIQHGPATSSRYYYMTGDEVDYNNQQRVKGLRNAREKAVRYDPADILEEIEVEKRVQLQQQFPKSKEPVALECEEDLLLD